MHVALADVPRLVTRERLVDVIRLAAAELPRFGFEQPRLALAGLNPHAGERGVMGTEEDDVLRPAVEACRADGIRVDGAVSCRHAVRSRGAGRVRRGGGLLP